MKEILTPAFIKQKTEAKDLTFKTRVDLVLHFLQFAPYGDVVGAVGFKRLKPMKDTKQNPPTFIECKVTDDVSIHFVPTVNDTDPVSEVWISLFGVQYYQVDPSLYRILRTFTRPKVKMNDLTVEIKHYTKTSGLTGEIDQVLAETFIRLGKYNYAYKVGKVSLTYTTRRYENTITLTVSPKIVFKVGQPDENYIRNVIDIMSKIDQFYQDYA